MATVEIPVTVLMRVEGSDLPPGPVGPAGGVLQRRLVCVGGVQNVTSQTSFQATALSVAFELVDPAIIAVSLETIIGHNVPSAAVEYKFQWDGIDMTIPSPGTVHGGGRVIDNKDFRFDRGIAYVQAYPGTHEVSVVARQSSGDTGATGYLGRRGNDMQFARANVLTVDVLSTAEFP